MYLFMAPASRACQVAGVIPNTATVSSGQSSKWMQSSHHIEIHASPASALENAGRLTARSNYSV